MRLARILDRGTWMCIVYLEEVSSSTNFTEYKETVLKRGLLAFEINGKKKETDSNLSATQQLSFKKYLDAERYPHFKAFAAEVDGEYSGWGWGNNKPEDAIETAMQTCGKKGADCRLYAVSERVVTNFSQDELSSYLREYYEKVLQFGDLRDIRQRALNGEEINTLISGREGEGVTVLHGLKFTMRFMASGRLMVRIIESKTALNPGNYGGEWWIEGDRYCRKYDKVLSGRTECFYVIKEENGIAWYTEDGAFNDRIRFTTPLSSE
jgi:hypothetical protein